jgi:hypothetical protein
MRVLALRLAFILLLDLVSASAARGSSIVIDQSFTPALSSTFEVGTTANVEASQVFAVGFSGLLTGLDLWIARSPLTVGDLLVSVLPTDLGGPLMDDGSALSSLAVPASAIPLASPLSTSMVHFEFSLPAAVTTGDVLAISLRHAVNSTSDTFAWYGGGDGSTGPIDYTGGSWYYRTGDESYLENTGSDFAFRTYVEVPSAPVPESTSSSVLLGIGILSITSMKRWGIHSRLAERPAPKSLSHSTRPTASNVCRLNG